MARVPRVLSGTRTSARKTSSASAQSSQSKRKDRPYSYSRPEGSSLPIRGLPVNLSSSLRSLFQPRAASLRESNLLKRISRDALLHLLEVLIPELRQLRDRRIARMNDHAISEPKLLARFQGHASILPLLAKDREAERIGCKQSISTHVPAPEREFCGWSRMAMPTFSPSSVPA